MSKDTAPDNLIAEQIYQDQAGNYYLRFRCMTCKNFTIPVQKQTLDSIVDAGATLSRAGILPGKYACPVCGQDDQYINVWIPARSNYHAKSKASFEQDGCVSLIHGELRQPWPDEVFDLPEQRKESLRYFVKKYGDWRDDLRKVSVT